MGRRFSQVDADGLFFGVAEGFAFNFRIRAKIEQESDFNLCGFQVIE